MHKNLRILLLMVSLLLFGALGISATHAFLTSRPDPKDNRFTVGHVDITVKETFTPPESLTVGDNVFQKKVELSNDGPVDSFARCILTFSNYDVRDISKVSSDGGTTWYSIPEFQKHLPSGWAYQENGSVPGYYYYTKALAPGERTTPLITHVKTTFQEKKADTDISINYVPQDYQIYVYAEGVQEQRKDGSDVYASYTEAWADFAAK